MYLRPGALALAGSGWLSAGQTLSARASDGNLPRLTAPLLRARACGVLLVLGLVVAPAAHRAVGHPVRTRNALKSGFAAIRRTGTRAGLSTGPAGTWVYRYRMAQRITAAVLVIAIILLAAPGLIERVGRPAAERAPAGPGHSGGIT